VKNVTRDNHYIPQLLLRNFTDDAGKLWIYDSERGKAWPGITKSAAFECKLYPPDIEKAFAEHIEGPGAVAITGLLERKCLDEDAWLDFIGFMAVQTSRTPAYFDRIAAMVEPELQETFERVAKYHHEFRDSLRKRLEQEGASPEVIDELFRDMESGAVTVHPTKEYVLVLALSMIETIRAELREMHWTFMGVPDGEPDLILGDHAVMLADAGPDDDPPGPLGLRNPNIELVMPLSCRMVAIARRTGPNSYGQLLEGSADIINERTLRYARRFVFAPKFSQIILDNAVKLRGAGPKVRVRRIQIGKGLLMIPEYR
jgi:hypothetical protein